jgi:light-regulated signal transduction histidine kinase (bacteriophytochrome)
LSVEKDSFVTADLNVLLKQVLDDLENIILEKQASFHLEPLPLLNVNPGLIKALFFNLVSNALKYSKEGESPVVKIYPEKVNVRIR